MTRKDFIKTGVNGFFAGVLVMLGFGCSSSSPEMPDDSEQTFVSSVEEGHTHTVTIQKSEVENPPGGGINRSTTSGGGHTHSFSMTQQQLQDVKDGQTVTVTDSVSSGHSHQYQISKWY